jgi:hypothetical protein
MDRLSMSLDQIIAKQEPRQSSRPNSSSGKQNNAMRGSRGNRNSRQSNNQSAPYHQQPLKSNRRTPTTGQSQSQPRPPASLKFLMSNYLSGIFIGSSGSSIRELEQITDAQIHISNFNSYYPGTQDRVVFMSGSEPAVTLAQSLMWEMIGQQTYADLSTKGAMMWDPSRAKEAPGQYDDVTVEGKISIPAGKEKDFEFSDNGLIVFIICFYLSFSRSWQYYWQRRKHHQITRPGKWGRSHSRRQGRRRIHSRTDLNHRRHRCAVHEFHLHDSPSLSEE